MRSLSILLKVLGHGGNCQLCRRSKDLGVRVGGVATHGVGELGFFREHR
jgi:hypothetical protein